MLNPRAQFIVDIIQWVLIIVLGILCLILNSMKNDVKDTISEKRQDDTFVKIYNSVRVKDLEKENAELAKRVKLLENSESAVEIRYVYRYKTDTIRVVEFVKIGSDSIYHYTSNNDTVNTNIEIKADNLDWCKVDTKINDKFTIVNTENKGRVETHVSHSPNIEISNVDAWHRKRNFFKEHFTHGPSAGLGYGVVNGKVDFFVGYTVGLRF